MVIMISLILLLISSASSIDVEVDIECKTCVLINNRCYNKTFFLDLEAPFRNSIVIHKTGLLRSENVLYYSFEPLIEDPEYFKIGFVNLDHPEKNGIISGGPKFVINFGTFDIDQDNGLIYLGGADGIFFLDTNTKKLMPYSSRGDFVTDLFYKNNVYFAKFDDKGIIVKKGDNFKTILEYIPVKNFVVNKYDIVIFINNFGLFVGKGETAFRVSKNAFFRGLAIDLDGRVFAWWIDGIYEVVVARNLVDSKIVKIVDMPSIGALTFDNENNMLITQERSLFKLLETSYNCSQTMLN